MTNLVRPTSGLIPSPSSPNITKSRAFDTKLSFPVCWAFEKQKECRSWSLALSTCYLWQVLLHVCNTHLYCLLCSFCSLQLAETQEKFYSVTLYAYSFVASSLVSSEVHDRHPINISSTGIKYMLNTYAPNKTSYIAYALAIIDYELLFYERACCGSRSCTCFLLPQLGTPGWWSTPLAESPVKLLLGPVRPACRGVSPSNFTCLNKGVRQSWLASKLVCDRSMCRIILHQFDVIALYYRNFASLRTTWICPSGAYESTIHIATCFK